MKKLLVAYDGSPCSALMLEDLCHAGLPAELDVTVVTVADVWLPPDPEELEPAFPDPVPKAVREARARAIQEVESSRALAEGACAHLKRQFPKWKLSGKAFADSPAWGIIKEAAAHKSDLIALGSHGRSPVGRFLLGSVAQKVAAESHRSVRIARPRQASAHQSYRILVALDGSVDSQAAAIEIAARTWPPSTEFRMITAVDPRIQTAVAWPGAYADRWVQSNDKTAEDWLGRMLEHSAVKLTEAGLRVETDIFDGDPKNVLIREAESWEADCIFLGSRGLDHGDRVILGTTASAVATRADCSVEIVRSN